jgi:uncharacterized Tic20 family protein
MPRKKKEEVVVPQEEPLVPEPAAPVEPPAVVLDLAPGPARPSPEEHRVAALAHGSILLNLVTGIGGPILALVLHFLYDRKSEYVCWHALQALVFQGITILLSLVLGGITGLVWLVTVPLMLIGVGFCLLPLALGVSVITVVVMIGSLVYGCAGALTVLEGKDFRYRWVSDWIHPVST